MLCVRRWVKFARGGYQAEAAPQIGVICRGKPPLARGVVYRRSSRWSRPPTLHLYDKCHISGVSGTLYHCFYVGCSVQVVRVVKKYESYQPGIDFPKFSERRKSASVDKPTQRKLTLAVSAPVSVLVLAGRIRRPLIEPCSRPMARIASTVGALHRLIDSKLQYKKPCARWVSKQLTNAHKETWLQKERFFLKKYLKRVMKHGSTTMSQSQNDRALSGSIRLLPLACVILLHDNARLHTAQLMKKNFRNGREIHQTALTSPSKTSICLDLLKEGLRGIHFRSIGEVKIRYKRDFEINQNNFMPRASKI
ncbi:hypothetical protein J6590_009733 [Homalodisca vitripennis]|nr:hypothetical protein J6590_009733 [Homalodisca vitripennis]